MAEKTSIQWTDSTWSPVRGCTRVSPGCGGPGQHGGCYAEATAARFSEPGQWGAGFAERTKSGPRWTGRVELQDDRLTIPLFWRKPRRIFVNSTSDTFHERLSFAQIAKIFAIMYHAPQHIYQVLTKRDDRLREFVTLELPAQVAIQFPRLDPNDDGDGALVTLDWPPPNCWFGVSVESADYKSRIDNLRATPAALRFLSLEPLLGDLGELDLTGIGWVIAGSESGHHARPCNLDWVRSLRDQCLSASVPFFWKQDARNGKKIPTPELDGKQWLEFPR